MASRFSGPGKPRTADDWLHLEWDLANLFSGAPVNEEDLFAGRSTEVKRILEAVVERSRHVILYGERGVGKTSLSNIFWRRYNTMLKSMLVARVQADPSDNFTSLWNKAIDELASTARQSDRYDLTPLDTNTSMDNPDIVRRELQKCRADATPIIIIDEYDKLSDGNARLLTANVIKYLYDYSANVTIILVGVAEDIVSLIEDHQSIDRAISQIKLNRMSDFELNEVIDKRLSKTVMKISGDARWTIVTLSRGLPYFTQMLGKYSAVQAAKRRSLKIDVEDVEAAMDTFIVDSEEKMQEAYRKATESNQKDNFFKQVLLACALAKTDQFGFFTPTDVIQPYSAIVGKKKTHAHFQRHLTEFISETRGKILIRRGGERQYRFRFSDPMMQPFVIIRGIQERLIDPQSRKRLLEQEQPGLPIGS
ncbi:AAA family ATPase [Novosphingobium album (ex Liu et al. 2023)]|nr:AAA family ATPase [Novosphingobium album (ex Liu et al. 2023)]